MLDSRQLMAMSSEAAILRCLVSALRAAEVDVQLEDLTPATSLSEDLGVDSFQLTNVARTIEEAYDLRFTLVDWVLQEEEVDGPAYTVRSLVRFIQDAVAECL